MNKKQEKIFVLVAAGAVFAAFIFAPWSNSYFGLFLDIFREPDWNDVSPHDIVKNAISMTLINKTDHGCKMSTQNLNNVVEHPYFVHGKDFAHEIKFNMNDETIVLPCEKIVDEKSKLHVWYIIEDAPRFGGKYKYFVTLFNDTAP